VTPPLGIDTFDRRNQRGGSGAQLGGERLRAWAGRFDNSHWSMSV
jgi:hypothetical protein